MGKDLYKEGSFALLQSDKRNYKTGQLIYYKVGQCNYNEGIVSKKGSFGANWRTSYYKVE